MRTYSDIKKAVVNKGYTFYSDDLMLNMIWERTDDIITNKFTDLLHVVYKDQGKETVFTIPATTKPGLKGSIDSPITHEGVTGTAIIVPGQYIDAWTFKDTFSEFSSYPYFRQYGKIDYWRDGDKDNEIDRVQLQEDEVFGTHWHKMSNVGTYGSGLVNNWSLGCMGAAEPEFKKILPIVRAAVAKYGGKFTGTLMESKDFNGAAGEIKNTGEMPGISYNFVEELGSVVVTASSLSVRDGAPNTSVPRATTHKKDTTLNYVGYVTDGESVGGNRKWFKESDGDYFWSGGVQASVAPIPVSENSSNLVPATGTATCTASSLRLRSEPNTNCSQTGSISKGQTIKYVGYVNNGEAISGNAKWYKSENGNYFWSGGVSS